MKKFFNSFAEKLKSNKKIQIFVAIVLIVLMFLLYFTTLSGSKNKKDNAVLTVEDYAEKLENKLSHVLSCVDGAGRVDVLITLEGGPTYEIAYTTEERVNNSSGSGSSTENKTIIKTPVLITKNGTTQPLILSEKNPKIVGVVVVAQGARDIKVKMELVRATEAALKIPLSQIEIFAGKQN